MSLKLKIKKLNPDAIIPSYGHDGDAAFDLHTTATVTIAPGERVQVPTGIAMAIPEGYVGLIWDKSGLSHKFGLKAMGGVIDAGYRGEVMIGMINLGDKEYTFEKGHKVSQMIIQERLHAEIETVEELDDSSRGTGGFGSTGK